MKHLGLAIINFLAIEKKEKELYFRAKEFFICKCFSQA